MELNLFSLSLCCLLLFFFFSLMKRVSGHGKPRLRLPPGPRTLPIIGNMHILTGALPHRLFRDLARNYGPVMHFQFGHISVVVISSPELAKEIMKTNEVIFAQRPQVLGASIISYGSKDLVNAPYGDYWKQLRKVCLLELLSAKRVQSFRAVREEEVSNYLQTVSSMAGSPINLSEMVFHLTSDITARTVFGRPCKEREEFKKALNEFINLRGGFDLADMFPSSKLARLISRSETRFLRVHRRLDKIITELIDTHREKGKKTEEDDEEDLVDVLLRLQQHGDLEFDLPLDSIKAVILDMFAAGTDTSATTMEWTMSQLLKNPRVMKKAQAEIRNVVKRKNKVTETDITEMKYLKQVIKETLRLSPPIPLLPPRESLETYEVNGYQIPKKSRVQINCWAIGRDPKYWDDPEEFKPERFENSSIDFRGQDFELLPFGTGRRGCPGIIFGVVIIELVIASLLYHFDWKLPNGLRSEDLDMSEGAGVAMVRKNSLYTIPIPYFP
ncbi:premnaspirodiene oxygenase-like [Aristolochia californica]|uniref:premnaspirodiene oxygenase-like n=1 Tax=Aristolochia californica TaxID=171875 RepID=UPI0035D70C21